MARGQRQEKPARERILAAAEDLFAESGFDATPTSRVAERAQVPKGLVHYYFHRKTDLLTALVQRLPDEHVEPASVVVRGDLAASLRRLVAELDRRLSASRVLSHLLWREADTHSVVRDALEQRRQLLTAQVRSVILAAGVGGLVLAEVDSAAGLLALALSHRHSIARHADDETPETIERELSFIAAALTRRTEVVQN